MLQFKDFVPCQIRAPRLGLSADAVQGEYESFDTALAAANEWRRKHPVRVVTVETVVLPNLNSEWEKGSTDTVLGSPHSGSGYWHQFIRIWYETDEQ